MDFIKMAQNLICLSVYENSVGILICSKHASSNYSNKFEAFQTNRGLFLPSFSPYANRSIVERDVDKQAGEYTNSGREITTEKNKNHSNKIHYCVQMYLEYKQFSEKHT